jgi:hypothetical protein
LKQILEQGAVTRDNQAWKRSFSFTNHISTVRQFISNRLAWMDEQWYDPNLLAELELTGNTFWKDDSWNTLCLPFRLSSLEGTPLSGATVKTLVSSEYSNGTLTLNFTEKSLSSIEAGKPYIVKWPEGENIDDPLFKDVITTEKTDPIETDYIDFVSTYSPITLEANDHSVLYLGDSNTLYYPTSDVPIKAYHAYFKLKNGLTTGDAGQYAPIRSLILNIDGETESIQTITADYYQPSTTSIWYTMDGIRLSSKPTQKGIYIVDGKIMSIK